MKTKISLLLLAILCNFSVFAQSDFDKYFEKKSLRVDFALSGNLKSQSAAIQGLREEPVWGGPVKNLIDKFNYGGYYINVYDKATNKLIYSRGFNTLFEEWRSTEQAKTKHNRGQTALPFLSRKYLSMSRSRHATRPTCNSIRC